MTDSTIPKPPKGTKAAGRRLWHAVVDDFVLAEHEVALLQQAARAADICADLQTIVDDEGPLVTTRLGEQRTHPALVELRNERALLARLLVALRVPIGDAEAAGPSTSPVRRAQRRGARGFYGIQGGAS